MPSTMHDIDKPVTKRNRIMWVDAAKGIAMILVFYGHLGKYWFPALKKLHLL